MDRAKLEAKIFVFRGQRVMLDADLAELYGVKTKRLNEQVRRNPLRFPADFAFRLTAEEKAEVVAKCDHLQRLRFSPVLPRVFSEHGALMLANVLNSPRAILVSIEVVRAFCRIRAMASAQSDLAVKLQALEERSNRRFATIFAAIRHLIEEDAQPRRRIGFRPEGLTYRKLR